MIYEYNIFSSWFMVINTKLLMVFVPYRLEKESEVWMKKIQLQPEEIEGGGKSRE